MNLATLLRDAPVKRKLISIVFMSAGAALLFAMVTLAVQQWVVARTEMVSNMGSHAEIISSNSTSAMLFDDPGAAAQTMGALATMDEVESAVIYRKDGKLFASYLRSGQAPPPLVKIPEGDGHSFRAMHMDLFHPIVYDGAQIGTIHIHATMARLYTRIFRNMTILLAAMLGGMGVAWVLVARLHPIITSPISELAELMERVSSEKNYALRVRPAGKDELGALGAEFNDMLAQVQSRDVELARYREHLEAEVAQRTARLTEAQRIAHVGNWEWDVVDNSMDWSDEIYRIFGFALQQSGASYEAFLQAVHPEDRQTVNNEVRTALEQGRIYSIDHRILLPDGTVRHVHEQAEVFRNDAGRAVKMLGTIQDITESKLVEEKIRKLNEELETKVQERTQQLLEAQEELVRNEKLAVLGQVAGSVGHELRNPLAVMSNAVYFLQTVLADADETTREYLNIIKDEITGSERIVSDLLDSVRTKPPQPKAVGVREVIGQTLDKLTIPASVFVKLDIPEALPALRVDVMQIHQVFRNLISNGMEAMPDGGTLIISAVENRQDKNISISVRDSGIGITEEQLGKLFQPLFTTKSRGIGLGLVVVKNLTQANGGTVKVESEVGKGSVFSVTLPGAYPEVATA
jgi:PAS domain S-box-containing protein